MMYEYPITIYEIQQQIEEQREEQLMSTIVQIIGYDVDKQELIKALQYDREQYAKGYDDCKSDMLSKIKRTREEIENEVKFWSEPSKYNVKPVAAMKAAKVQSYKHCLELLDKLITEGEESENEIFGRD